MPKKIVYQNYLRDKNRYAILVTQTTYQILKEMTMALYGLTTTMVLQLGIEQKNNDEALL